MTYQDPGTHFPSPSEAGRQIAQLRHVLGLVEQIAGRHGFAADADLDEGAQIASAYEAASSVVQRRFDALADEVINWAAAGVKALIEVQIDEQPPVAAAAALADELGDALNSLRRLVRA